MRGAGRVTFAATLLLIAGTLNIIYGIGALGDARVFVGDQRFIFTNLNALGWVLILLGVIQLSGGFSLIAGSTYGRVIGLIGAGLGAIGALLSVGGAYPWWSLAISPSASTSSTASSSTARRRARHEPELGYFSSLALKNPSARHVLVCCSPERSMPR
jgi:hypothetical protein